MPYSLCTTLVLVALASVLSVAPVAPEAGNVIFLALGAVCIPLVFGRGIGQFRRPVVWMPLLGLLLIAVAYGLGSASITGLIGLAYFAPVVAILPLLSSAKDTNELSLPRFIGCASLAGVAAAAAVAVVEFVFTGQRRAGMSVANPIHFADVALLVGFLACAGMIAVKGQARYIFIAGPLFASVAVILSGTRGAVVAAVAMSMIAGVMLLALRLISMRSVLLAMALVLVAGLIAALLGAGNLSGIARVATDIAEILRTGMPTDGSTDIRLGMIRGGREAFFQAPIFGHGPLAFVNLANDLSGFPPGNWPHLHNDLADFAASAGVLGLTAYVLFILAPIAEVISMPKIVTKAQIFVLVSTLMGGFFLMGLTNAMFGILTVTTIYAAICVITGILVSQANALADR